MKIDQALLDVRKAYRLLHDYQRMVIDAVNYIGKQLNVVYVGGWPRYSDASPRAGRGELDSWAWDWLNMMFYEFHFERQIEEGKHLRLSLLLISDTGYFCAEDEMLQKTNLRGYLAADASATKLGFILSAEYWPDTGFTLDKAQMKSFIENRGELPIDWSEKGFVGGCVDINRLASEEETIVLLDEIVALARSSGIPLNRTSSTSSS